MQGVRTLQWLFLCRKEVKILDIKKVNDKPMVIHKKKNARLPVKSAAKAKRKSERIFVVGKTPKALKIKRHDNRTGEKHVKKKSASSKVERSNFVPKEDRGKTEQKEKESHKQARKAEENKGKNTVKKKEAGSAFVSAGAAVAVDQLDGGSEVYDSYITAKTVIAPAESMAEAGKNLFQSQTVKEKEKQTGKNFSNNRNNRKTVANHTDKKKDKAVNSANTKDSQAKKESAKFQKEKRKEKEQKTEAARKRHKIVSKKLGNAEKGKQSRTSAYRDMQSVNRNRKIQFFLDKLNAEEKQKDSFSKLAKDLFLNRVMFAVNKAAPVLGFALLGLMLLVTLAAVPVMAVVAVIYNSPFAIFFPSISSGSSTQQVLSSYMSEFYEDINSEMENHYGYDVSQKFYADYDGEDVPDNYYDVLAVYMVVYGNGDTATDMTEEAEENLKSVFDDMCSYYITDRTDIEWDEEGEIDSYMTVKEVNVKLKWYSDMVSEYGLNTEEQEMLAELMKPEYLAVLRQTVDGDRGESISPEQYQAVLDAVSDENGRQVVSYVLSKVGYPYSQAYRDSGNYYDCSSLAYYAWQRDRKSVV